MLFQIAIVALLALTNAVQVKRGGDLCSVCVGVIGYVEGFVSKGEGLAEIEGEFDRVCPLFDSFQPECEGIVSEFLPAAIEYLGSNDSPSQVCQKIALCSNQNNVVEDIVIPEEVEEEKPSVAAPASGFCTICETVVHYVEAYIEQNSTIAEMEQKLDQVCALTPFKTQCDTLVKNELPKIIHYIESKATPKEICTRVGVCAQTLLLPVNNQVVEKKEQVEQPEAGFCSICEAIVGFVEHYLEQNSTVKHIEAQLDKACELTGAYEAECKALVNQYLPEIIHYVEKKETPAQICTRIGVCTKALATAILSLQAPQPKAQAPNAGFCGVCKAIVGFVEAYVEQNKTVKHIEEQLDQACALTGPYEAECKALVHQYLPEMIHYVEKKESPTVVCERLGVCTKTSSELIDLLPSAMALQQAASKRNVGGLSGCLLCKTLVGYVEMYINRNETTTNIEKKLHRFCKIVKKFEQQCDLLIDTELEKIIQKLEAKESPEKVCDQLKACDEPTQAPQSVTPRVQQEAVSLPQDDPALCAVCEGIIAIGEHYARNNKTVHEIEKELKQLCSYTGNYQMVCDGLVETYVVDIEEYILNKATPAQVCETLHACTKPSLELLASPSVNVGGPLTCKFCEVVVRIVENGLKAHETEHIIEKKLEKFCHLSKHFEKECDALLEKDLGKVIAYLEAKEPPQKVCDHLHLCK